MGQRAGLSVHKYRRRLAVRNLLILHDRGQGHDFGIIAGNVARFDPSINVTVLPCGARTDLGDGFWQRPTLTVALRERFGVVVRRGPVFRNRPICKLEQQRIFLAHGIPTPVATRLELGGALDPDLFGERVIVKPIDLTETSHGENIFLFERTALERMTPNDFPEGHPLRVRPETFIVQRYVHTGDSARCIRVGTFLGKAILNYKITVREKGTVASNMGERDRRLIVDAEAIALAEKTHAAFPTIPLLGIDIVRDHTTGAAHVLEVNAGGNTWHFSSQLAKDTRISLGEHHDPGHADHAALGGQLLEAQFGAFEIVAQQLVLATQSEAE
jgi:hypothetical protein